MARRRAARHGTAALETAVVLPFLFIMLYGVWEVGRMVQIYQIVSNAAREGGRQAATGNASASALSGSNPAHQVQQAVGNYIQNCGLPIPTSQIVVTVTNETKTLACTGTVKIDTANTTNVVVTQSGSPPSMDPVLKAAQYDTLKVEVTFPFEFARWSPSNLYFYVGNGTKIYAVTKWPCMRDKPVAIDSTIPTSPL